MSLLINCIFVGAGGFVGSILRYLVSLLPIGNSSGFPYTTFFVNVLGAFMVGFFVAYLAKAYLPDNYWVLFLRVGLCGGFTTFSAFSLESMQLLQNGEFVTAAIYIGLSIILCIGAVFAGEAIAAWLFGQTAA